ncbi:PQQ-like beta-propeller repeat protein, partial [bacterium]|nr:PQQ-like beta-propeller repeat protein [bacterium]
EAKLTGFNALAPAAKTPASAPAVLDRLERGPAYGAIGNRKSPIANPADWPTYRHDGRRSSATDTAIPTDLTLAWRTRIGARPSSVVVAEGKLFVADVDGHAVHAVNAANGKPAWSAIAGARVDSPPTVYEGLAIFGSADGWVHCLRASDGARVWRFQAAPMPRRVVAFGQLESPWPVPGSVLIHDGKCWFAAGRSSYLDGGITLYALDPATGRVERQEVIYSADPATGKMAPQTSGFSMPGLLNDIPSTDGASVFIRQMPVAASGGGGKPPRERGPRVFTTAGYLDPSWFNRTFWKSGRAQTSGLMVLGHGAAYGVEVYPSRSRESVFRPGARAYRLMCLSLKPLPRPAAKGTKQPRARLRGPEPVWEKRVGIRIIAMARAANTIFVAGSPDVVDPQDPHGAWEGRKGGVLAAFSAADGQKLCEHKLPSPPVFDAMAIAVGRLYLSTMDGHVLCMAGKP